MPWFKVDDKLHDHRKVRIAQKEAMGVWVLAGSWASDNLTDGFVPETVLLRWGTREDAERLVAAGLWYADEHEGERGWRFHEWAQRNPLRADKLRERAAKAEAGRMGGKASGIARAKQSAKQSASESAKHPAEQDAKHLPKQEGKRKRTPEPEPEPSPSIEGESLSRTTISAFDEFWNAYPRREAKQAAQRAWAKAVKAADPAHIIAGAQRYADDPNRDPAYTRHAATWLNAGCWDDAPLPPRHDRGKPNHDDTVRSWGALAMTYDHDDRKAIGQ